MFSYSKKLKWKQKLAGLMSMVLLLGNMYVVPVEAAAAKEYVLDASTLTTGDITADQTAGTDNYFTLRATSGKKFTVQDSKMTMTIDGVSVETTKRLKANGDGSATERAIAFTVTEGMAATIHIGAESNSTDQLGTAVLYNADTQEEVGEAYKTNVEKTGTVFSWEGIEAGNYYIISKKQDGVSTTNVNFRYVKVVESPLSVTKEYILDASTLTTGDITADQTAGTDNYFTLRATSGKKFTVQDSKMTMTIDGVSVETTKRLKANGDGSATERAIAFTVTEGMAATIHIGAESNSTDQLGTAVLYNADTQEEVGEAYKTNVEKTGTVFSWEGIEAGNYYIISKKQDGVSTTNVNFRYVKVVETTAGSSVKAPTVSGADATLAGDIATVSANGIPGSDGSKWVVEATKDVSGEWIQSGTAEGNTNIANVEVDLSGEKYGSGTWYFRVYGKGTENSAPMQAANSVTYTLPLGTTEIAVQPADGQVTVTWDAVREAESYKVAVYDAETAGNVVGSATVAADADTEAVVNGLTNGVKYWAEVTTVRGGESTVSERVAFRPYKAVDSSNAIPGLAISSTNGAAPIILRENGNITISQTASSGGMNSAGTVENVTFVYLNSPVAAGTDFTITADVVVTGGSNTGSAGGVFLGASTGAEEGAKYIAMGLRGNNSISAYRCKADGTAGGSSDTNKWVAGETYTLTATRSGDSYTVVAQKGTDVNFSKTYPADDIYAGLNGDTVYPAILLNGVNADITNIKITVDGAIVYDSTTLTGSVNPFEDNWAIADTPVLQTPVVDNEKQEITVVCEGEVGITGAGSIAVDMINEEGEVVDTQTSSAFGQTIHTLTFNPEDSGVYSFKATASRPGEETVKESNTVTAEKFILALADTTVVAFNKDNGTVKLVWDAVKEATGYNVYYKLKDDASYPATPAVANTQELNCQISGLTAGSTYTFCVKAVRDGEEAKVESTVDKLVVNEVEREWYFAAFGSSTNKDNNGYSGSVADGEVSVWSLGGKGKLVPNSTDGIAFYYTAMDPETENFTLSADITVNEWTYSNGQEGFGIMAADRVGVTGDSSSFWNNSYMATVTKVEYYYDEAAQAVADAGTKYSMKMGVGSQEKKGVTAELLDLFNVNDTETVNTYFKNEMTTLETGAPKAGNGAGTYNIVGNYTKEPTGTIDNLTTFHLEVKRNNTGYIVSYTNEAGETVSQKYYHGDEGDELLKIDKDNIYIGFYASRNAKITVNNISLTTIHPDEDAPAEERPVTTVTPSYAITSATISNSADYQMVYYGNADGTLVIKDANGNEVANTHVNAEEHFRVNTTLTKGVNDFTVKFTPDADYRPSKYEVLSTYEAKEFTHSVTYEVSESNIIYIAPNGVASAAGTKEDPMDVYTAVRIVAPGQSIVVMEGTYLLDKTVTVEPSISGTAAQRIRMIADPNASTRPVFDFQNICAGMVYAGDYWYIEGFAVTNSLKGQKGMQISGDYNIVENIHAYRNGNTGIQISRYKSAPVEDWPSYNLILNCTSWLNADAGYEDADGFAAKLTVGEGNVFDGCIAAYNADDGWDLYAKVESGPIGQVVIRNSIAFKNGYDIDENGNEIIAGNGNGFKMGGESISGHHILENSIAFANRAKGIDSNSCPDIQVINATSFDNESYNVAFYTNNAANTDFSAQGIISFKQGNDVQEQLKLKGTQDNSKVYGSTNYYFDGTKSANVDGVEAKESWFVSLDTEAAINGGITRYEDGSINMNGYLQLTSEAPEDAGARFAETAEVSSKVIASESTEIPESVLTDEVKAATNCETVEQLVKYLKESVVNNELAAKLLPGLDVANTRVTEVTVLISNDGGNTWEVATAENFPKGGLDILLSYPEGTNASDYEFVVGHLVVLGCNGLEPGTMEYMAPIETEDGLLVHAMSASPFVVGWKEVAADDAGDDSNDDSDDDSADDDSSATLPGGQAGSTSPKTYDDSNYVPVFVPSYVADDADASEDKVEELPVDVVAIAAPTAAGNYWIIIAIAVAAVAVIASRFAMMRKEDEE